MKNKNLSFINHISILFFLGMLSQNLIAQDFTEEKNALSLTARAFDNSIKLRWAPSSMNAWKACNEAGYILERFTIRRGDEIVDSAERTVGKILTPSPLKPFKTAEEWKPLMEKNEYAAIAAQALYGKSFSVTNNGNPLKRMKDERDNRYSFGLFAADQSVEVAQALALYYDDKTVEDGTYYLYKIYPAVVPSGITVDTGYVYLGTDEVYELPKPLEIETDFGDRIVYISWDKKISQKFYSSFIVERSTNGQDFQEVNTMPYVGIDKDLEKRGRMMMMDSLEVNDQLYVYRVKGRTIFDEIGPVSDEAQGIGINPKVANPVIKSISNQNNTALGIGWNFLKENEEEIIGFQLSRSNNDQGPYEVITGANNIDKSLRYFIDESPLPVNYYKIIAIDRYGRMINSFAALAQLEDSTPPAPPINLRGKIMEDGEMIVTWASNEEPDIMGYRVYMANRKDRKEYVQITSEAISQNFFSYFVPMNTLSEEVFFKVRALDYRQNKSDFSEIGLAIRPDSIAPAAPVFVSARPTSSAINLLWENSASSDVAQLFLERKAKKDSTWTNIKTFNYPDDLQVKSYQDTSIQRGQMYQYRMKAVDDAALSTFSRIISASKIDNGIRRPIEDIESEIDRTKKVVILNWEYLPDGKDLTHFVIYRSSAEGRPVKYDAIKKNAAKQSGKSWRYKDNSLQMDTDYKYQIRAVYTNGAQSPLSKLISINY